MSFLLNYLEFCAFLNLIIIGAHQNMQRAALSSTQHNQLDTWISD